MTPLQTLEATVAQAERCIEIAGDHEGHIRRQLTRGCALAEGYYLAGAVSKFEYLAACKHLRSLAAQRISLLELKRAAIEAGLG